MHLFSSVILLILIDYYEKTNMLKLGKLCINFTSLVIYFTLKFNVFNTEIKTYVYKKYLFFLYYVYN